MSPLTVVMLLVAALTLARGLLALTTWRRLGRLPDEPGQPAQLPSLTILAAVASDVFKLEHGNEAIGSRVCFTHPTDDDDHPTASTVSIRAPVFRAVATPV